MELQADGSTIASTEAYRENFRVSSMATTELVDGNFVSEYYEGEETCREALAKLQGRPLLAHNAPFEMLVSLCRFPELKLNWCVDTMRLVQNLDNGGDPYEFDIVESEEEGGELEKEYNSGLSLASCIRRVLKQPDHKKLYYKYLVDNGHCKKGQEGAHLHLLPPDLMRDYNIQDTEMTMKIYQHCMEEFARSNYDWTMDHGLYFSTCKMVVAAQKRGVKVLREPLKTFRDATEQEMVVIGDAFLTRFATDMQTVERIKLLEEVRKRKTLRGRKRFIKRLKTDQAKWNEVIKFNVGSNKQLQQLFVDVLKMEPKFLTATGQPSFKSSLLSQWGEGGEMLGKRRKRLIVARQAGALYELSEISGRWHLSLKIASTRSGRMSGGSY